MATVTVGGDFIRKANLDTVLELFKIDMGITHTARDEYFKTMILGALKELDLRGVDLDLSHSDDQMLLTDYCTFNYRHRDEDVPLSKNLELRIMNRTVKKRGHGLGHNEHFKEKFRFS